MFRIFWYACCLHENVSCFLSPWLSFMWLGLNAHVIRLPSAAACRIWENIRPVTIEPCNFPVKWALIFFSVISRNTVVVTTLAKSVSVISTFSQLVQVVRWSLDFLSPYSLLLFPKRFSSCNFWKASHAPCTGKLTAKCPLCSTRSPSFSRQPQHFHLNTTPAETMTPWIKSSVFEWKNAIYRVKRSYIGSATCYSWYTTRISPGAIFSLYLPRIISCTVNLYSVKIGTYRQIRVIGLAKSKKVVSNISRQMFSEEYHSDFRNSVIITHNFLKGLQRICQLDSRREYSSCNGHLFWP